MFQTRIHGRGGQGVVTAAELLSIAAFIEGRHAQAFPSFGSERTGAPVVSYCRIVAQRYGCFAEFRSFDQMLMIAIAMSFFGFVFAAPGAVMINGRVDKTKNGIISAAGPIVNLVLAFLFLSISMVTYAGLIKIIAFYGFFINSWLAMFNMIPVWNLDGAKVLKWNKKVYGIIVAVALLFLFLKNFISIA